MSKRRSTISDEETSSRPEINLIALSISSVIVVICCAVSIYFFFLGAMVGKYVIA